MIFVWCGLTLEAEITDTGLKIGLNGIDVTGIALEADPELKELLTNKINDEQDNRFIVRDFRHGIKSEQ